jgi:hypothetical protein
MNAIKFTVTMIITLLFFSILICATFTINSKAEPLVRLVQDVELEWENPEEENIPIIPRDELRIINVTITYTFNYGLAFSEGMYLNYINYEDIHKAIATPFGEESYGRIKLEVVETPDWCYAAFRYPIVAVNITSKYVTQMPLYIIIDEDAPAFEQGVIKVKANIDLFPTVKYIIGVEKIEELSFQPAYNPIISVDLPDVNTKQIRPRETANFPIKITNIGNDQTVVSLKVESIPKGWSAVVTDEVLLDKEESYTATLTISPPKDIGYREDLGIIRISLTPSRAYDQLEVGDEMSLSFLVQSKGFFAEGQGTFSIFGIIIFLAIIIIFLRLIVKRKI